VKRDSRPPQILFLIKGRSAEHLDALFSRIELLLCVIRRISRKGRPRGSIYAIPTTMFRLLPCDPSDFFVLFLLRDISARRNA
jgi:hypothetical protein